jgi:hypothetical protein
LLDEVRFAMRYSGISSTFAYRMVTTIPAAILGLGDAQGTIMERGQSDLIAIRDSGQDPADRLPILSMNDIELVMIGGRVQLASEAVLERLPFAARQGLEAISIDGFTRWLRAPVQTLLHRAEDVLGKGEVRLGSRRVCIPAESEAAHAY